MKQRKKFTAAERRASIVTAAINLFSARGFRGVTTRELAKASGVSEPVLYEHFADKEELYSAILEEACKDGDAVVLRIEATFSSKLEAPEFFHALAESIIKLLDKNPNYSRLILFSALEGHSLAELHFENRMKPFYGMLMRRIRDYIDAGSLNPCDPAVAARAFLGMVNQYALFDLHFGFSIAKTSRKKVVHGMVNIFLHGISK
jgi:AcrR family transcriptional regulator